VPQLAGWHTGRAMTNDLRKLVHEFRSSDVPLRTQALVQQALKAVAEPIERKVCLDVSRACVRRPLAEISCARSKRAGSEAARAGHAAS
jgi:hypothetical protein